MNAIAPFALALVAGLFAGCSHQSDSNLRSTPELPAVAVRVQAVQAKTRPNLEEVVGTVRATLRATLEAKVSGRVTQMPVVLGQQVKAGQLVARLDAPEIKARVDQAQAALLQAERDWKRNSSLLEQQAVTRSEYDAVDSRYQVAKAALAEAQAMVAYVEVTAPFDGVVTRKLADVGDLAAPGKPLVEIENPAALQLEADIPEDMAARIERSAQMTVRVGSTLEPLQASVSEIAPAADPISRTFRVKLDLPRATTLKSGQFARLVVPVGESSTLRVPASAVVRRGQMEIAFAVEDQHARLHLVKTGQIANEETEILSGLDAGDSVVIEGAAQLTDGQPVTVK